MRAVLLLLILVIAVSGCGSSGVNMYSMPPQRRVIVRAENMQTDFDTLPTSFRPVKNNKQIAKARKKSPPNRKKKSSKSKGKGKGILGSILGATVELAKVAIKTYGQKLPKIPGF